MSYSVSMATARRSTVYFDPAVHRALQFYRQAVDAARERQPPDSA